MSHLESFTHMCLLGVISSNDCTGKSRGNQHGEERALFFWTGFTLELNWLFFKGSLVRGLKFWSHFSPFKFQSGSNTFQFGPHNWVNLAPKIGAKNSPISMGPNWPQASTKLDPLALAPFFGPNPLFSFYSVLGGFAPSTLRKYKYNSTDPMYLVDLLPL